MSKHTPGPWTAVKNSAYWEIDGPDDFGGVADTCASSAGEPDFGRSMALGEANARLIAAAPDLLSACRGLLDAIHDSMTHESQNHHREQIDAAFAAVEKAEGETK